MITQQHKQDNHTITQINQNSKRQIDISDNITIQDNINEENNETDTSIQLKQTNSWRRVLPLAWTLELGFQSNQTVELTDDLIERLNSASMKNTLQSMLGLQKLQSFSIGKLLLWNNPENNNDLIIKKKISIKPDSIFLIQPEFLITNELKQMFKYPITNCIQYNKQTGFFSPYISIPTTDLDVKEYKLDKLVISRKTQETKTLAVDKDKADFSIKVIKQKFLPFISIISGLPYSTDIFQQASIVNEKYYDTTEQTIVFRYIPRRLQSLLDIGTTNNQTILLHGVNTINDALTLDMQELIHKYNNNTINLQEQRQLAYLLKVSRENMDVNSIISTISTHTTNDRDEIIVIDNKSSKNIELNLQYTFVYTTINNQEKMLIKNISKQDENILTVFHTVTQYTADMEFQDIQEITKLQLASNKLYGFWGDLWNSVKDNVVGPLKELGVNTVNGIANMIGKVITN